ncbi:hypothetical protein AVW16_02375 [Crenobacter luteus]|uniref:Uncharacterized protein n=1 Tax=Crenobacter luteus TaxID=1452487 RepID=A0A165ELY7_9NEIS|nr:hypothetical protein AVW16_02375 [Crenobacter luteus]
MHYHRCFSVSETTVAAAGFSASGQGLALPAGTNPAAARAAMNRGATSLAGIAVLALQHAKKRTKYK